MKRTDKIDHPFDKERFSTLLKRASSYYRSLSEYGRVADISYSYLNKYLNQKFDKPPVVATLRKMSAATDKVAFSEFLDAAGYDPEKYGEETQVKNNGSDLFGPVLLGLYNADFTWKIRNDSFSDGAPVQIFVENSPVKRWFLVPVLKKNIKEDEISAFLMGNGSFESDSKVSFITDSDVIFNSLKNMSFPLLSLCISVIKVSGNRIEEEVPVKTSQNAKIQLVSGSLFSPVVLK